ncbi:MAG TPA: helix-turn-helix transcriptional regulator [Acidimicrobiales bacterium]|nr:helix-turn-helix transcriptional regulator [Acidimicrobiales bacterium]
MPTGGWKPASPKEGELVRWNLRLKAAERGIWKSTEMRRLLADSGLEFSAGKMSALWSGTPTSIRLDDLDVICAVLDCDPSELLIREPDKVAARRPQREQAANGNHVSPVVSPRFGQPKSEPPL